VAAHWIWDCKVNRQLKVIMDSNFLMIPIQFNVDILSEISRLIDVSYDLFVPDKVLVELQTLAKKGNLKERKAARVGLELAKGMKILRIEGASPDDALVSIADESTVICTNDKLLRKRILKKGGKAIFLRQKRFLELVGGEVGLS
jgi:rRNA-processing protein FCF1